MDDEAAVVRLISIALQRAGHEVITAESGFEAKRVAADEHHIDLIIMNHRIAPERGRDIAEHILITHPEMRVMHISGYPRGLLEDEGSLTPGAAFLQKPFTAQDVRKAVEEMVD